MNERECEVDALPGAQNAAQHSLFLSPRRWRASLRPDACHACSGLTLTPLTTFTHSAPLGLSHASAHSHTTCAGALQPSQPPWRPRRRQPWRAMKVRGVSRTACGGAGGWEQEERARGGGEATLPAVFRPSLPDPPSLIAHGAASLLATATRRRLAQSANGLGLGANQGFTAGRVQPGQPATPPPTPPATPPPLPAGATSAFLVPGNFSGGGGGAPGGAPGGAGGGGAGAAALAGIAAYAYAGPATAAIVPNTVARTLPQLPPGAPRPLIITNPLYFLANGPFQNVIYAGGTTRSPGLPTVPTPTPPVPAAIYQDPYTTAVLASGTSLRTDPAVLSIFRSWPLNNLPPTATIGQAASASALICQTPLQSWCTNTLPDVPNLYRPSPPANTLGYFPPNQALGLVPPSG